MTDSLIRAPLADRRFGVTLLLRPSESVTSRIQTFLHQVKKIEPSQYYQPDSDLHITVMSIISCYEGFDLNSLDLERYYGLIEKSLDDTEPFQLSFKGITASPSCVMIQGFMKNDSLNRIRDNLRENFRNSSLEQSIDKRYAIRTAHSTVIRFTNPLNNQAALLSLLEEFRTFDFGSMTVNEMEFAYNDWCLRKERGKILKKFAL